MPKTVEQELKEIRRRVRQLEGSPKAEDVLPFLRPEGGGRASFDDVLTICKQNLRKLMLPTC
jgi:hypothetical protein